MRRTRSLRIKRELRDVKVYLSSPSSIMPGEAIYYIPGESYHYAQRRNNDRRRRTHIAFSLIADLQDAIEHSTNEPICVCGNPLCGGL